LQIEECVERLRAFDEKVLVNKAVLAKARFDLLCAQMDHEYASLRAQVAQRQRIHLEKGLPMEAYDELEREGVFGPLTSKA
jgi:AmiR/NasT family two-component response regulator